MYLIKKSYFDISENVKYTQVVGVINGDESCALTWMREHEKDLGVKYKDPDGVEYPYFTKEYAEELLVNEHGCSCCLGDKAVYWENNENNAFIDNSGEMLITAKDKTLRFKVNNCPNCGRKFVDEI